MSVDQLIAKALSTTSEDEAIACLKMARKRGGKLTTTETKATIGGPGKDVEYWCSIAKAWHSKYQVLQLDMVSLKQSHLRDLNKAKLDLNKAKLDLSTTVGQFISLGWVGGIVLMVLGAYIGSRS